MADEKHPGALADPLPYRLDDLFCRADRQRNGRAHIAAAALAADKFPGLVQSTVLVIVAEDLIAGSQRQGAGHDVQGGGGVGRIKKIFLPGTQECGQNTARFLHQSTKAPPEKFYRLALQLPLPILIDLKHRPGTGPEGPVIEKNDIGIDQEQIAQIG